MKKDITVAEKGLLVKLRGEMYIEDAEDLRRDLLEYIAQGKSCVVIDMSDLNYVDSSGIAALIAVNKSALRSDGKVTLIDLQDAIRELFRVTCLDKVFQIQEQVKLC